MATGTKKGVVRWDFNECETWRSVCATYEPVLRAMARKYCSADVALQEDAISEARIAIHTVRPERIKNYDPAKHGSVTADHVPGPVDRYVRQVARNSILSLLSHRGKGRWDTAQTIHLRDRKTGRKYRKHMPARHTSLEDLRAKGLEIDTRGSLSWQTLSTDGLLPEESHDDYE